MEKLIKFRLLASKLSDDEFSIFKKRWISLLDRELIESMIFHYFKSDNNSNNNKPHYALNGIQKLVTDIIKSRNKNKKTTMNQINYQQQEKSKESMTCNRCKSLTDLPYQLIGEINSHLFFKDYNNFQKTNRYIYISCNSPSCTLQYYEHMDYSKYLTYNLQKYSLIKTLTTKMESFLPYIKSIKNHKKWKDLEQIRIYCQYTTQQDIERFMNIDCISFNKIKSLRIGCFGYNGSKEDNYKLFIKFLSCFKNITSLSLTHMNIGDYNTYNTWVDWKYCHGHLRIEKFTPIYTSKFCDP